MIEMPFYQVLRSSPLALQTAAARVQGSVPVHDNRDIRGCGERHQGAAPHT